MMAFLSPRFRILCKIPTLAMAALLVLSSMSLTGCEMFGAPTPAELKAADAKIEAAEKETKTLEDALAKMKAEKALAEKQSDKIAAQREALSAVQSRVALELANAQPEARPYLEAQLDQIRRQARTLDETAKGYAETIAAFDRDISVAAAEVDSARKQLAIFDESRAAMDQAVQDAKDRVTNGFAAVGKIVGNFVPGVGAISEQASQGLAAILGTVTLGTSAVALRSRARRKEADEKAKENEQKFVQTVESVEALRKIDPAVAESMSKNKGVMWEALDEKTWEAIKLVQARVGAK